MIRYEESMRAKKNQKPMAAEAFIFVCSDCRRVFELKSKESAQGAKVRVPVYYFNMPKYGKKEKVCPECKGE